MGKRIDRIQNARVSELWRVKKLVGERFDENAFRWFRESQEWLMAELMKLYMRGAL